MRPGLRNIVTRVMHYQLKLGKLENELSTDCIAIARKCCGCDSGLRQILICCSSRKIKSGYNFDNTITNRQKSVLSDRRIFHKVDVSKRAKCLTGQC